MQNKKAFSMLELTIVITIMGFLTVGILEFSKGTMLASQYKETKQKLNIIENAVNQYILENNRLPCPAGIKLASSSTDYGKESRSNEECIVNAVNGIKLVSENLFIGGIPFLDLGLGVNYDFDSWNNKITLLINKEYSKNIFKSNLKKESSKLITVNNKGTKNEEAVFVLVSNGRNKSFALNRKGVNSANQKGLPEEKNNSYNFKATKTIFENSNSKGFDDLIRYSTKKQIIANYNIYDTGCFLENLEDREINSKCPWTNKTALLSENDDEDYLSYKSKIFKYQNSLAPIPIDTPICIVECGNYGRLIIFEEFSK